MTRGLFDDVPMTNTARDKAWEKFIKRKDVKAFMKGRKDFPFPLDGSYDLWCIAWNMAWDAGFNDGYDSAVEQSAAIALSDTGEAVQTKTLGIIKAERKRIADAIRGKT